MALRRASGFKRYAFSCQYHGASFLGFTHQGDREDRILPDGADLRGYRSVEGRLRQALDDLFGESHYENIQVSSRTDRGVHALKNTFHVDIQHPNSKLSNAEERIRRLHRGLNYYLGRQTHHWHREQPQQTHNNSKKRRRRNKPPSNYTFSGDSFWNRYSANDELRILSVVQAPNYMDNPFSEQDPSQSPTVDWNARFSATERTYIYRVLCYSDMDENWAAPFEWDRSWRIRCTNTSINIHDMQQAAIFLQGTHDFSTFQGRKCQRSSPIVAMKSIQIHSQPYGAPFLWGGVESTPGLLGMHGDFNDKNSPQLITIRIVGNSFLYRQVRNMVGCLIEVGLGKLKSAEVEDLLECKNREEAPSTAPAHGLFLADVKHGDFYF
jgi:tRNA pseudouridine38-40 synthase